VVPQQTARAVIGTKENGIAIANMTKPTTIEVTPRLHLAGIEGHIEIAIGRAISHPLMIVEAEVEAEALVKNDLGDPPRPQTRRL
jgi:hypothetical protein